MVWARKLYALLRVSHWSKSLFVLLGVIYTNIPGYWPKALLAALAFCLIASAVYIYNDLQDLEEDRQHPKKQQRPLANEDVSVRFALITLGMLLITGLVLGFYISSGLAFILGSYLLINLIYNHGLRNIPVFDVICIASGFMLRILAGTLGIGLPITWWLALAATLLSLFIALGKRRLEMHLASNLSRAVLKKYHPQWLDRMIVSTAIGCFVTYLLYVVYVHEDSFFFLLTLPFAAFGLWRFTRLTVRETENDDPIALLFSDNLSRVNLLCFFVLTIAALTQ